MDSEGTHAALSCGSWDGAVFSCEQSNRGTYDDRVDCDVVISAHEPGTALCGIICKEQCAIMDGERMNGTRAMGFAGLLAVSAAEPAAG